MAQKGSPSNASTTINPTKSSKPRDVNTGSDPFLRGDLTQENRREGIRGQRCRRETRKPAVREQPMPDGNRKLTRQKGAQTNRPHQEKTGAACYRPFGDLSRIGGTHQGGACCGAGNGGTSPRRRWPRHRALD